MVHVIPIHDSISHSLDTSCTCNPAVEYGKGDFIVVHDALDGRLGVEWANQLLNQPTQRYGWEIVLKES